MAYKQPKPLFEWKLDEPDKELYLASILDNETVLSAYGRYAHGSAGKAVGWSRKKPLALDKGKERKPRFPVVSIATFILVAALGVIATVISAANCAFGFGGFQCNGWVGSISGFLFLWSLIAVVAIPLSLIIALWRLVRWYRSA